MAGTATYSRRGKPLGKTAPRGSWFLVESSLRHEDLPHVGFREKDEI